MNNKFLLKIKERIRKEARHMGILSLDVAILVMCVVLVYSAFSTARLFYEINDRGYSSAALYYRLQDGNYALLAEMTWTNRMVGKGEDADAQEYYAVADYYEAAMQYRLCQEAQDTDGAARWLEKMKDAESRIGVFAAEIEKIDQMLGN